MRYKILLIIKNTLKHNRVLMFCCMFLCGSITNAQNNNDSLFYVVDKASITGEDQIFIASNLNSNQQKIFVDVKTIFYNSDIESFDIEYINNIQKNISKNTKKQLSLTQNKKQLKERVNKVIHISSQSDNFPIGRYKIDILYSASSSITYHNSSKKINIVDINHFNFENLLITQSNNKHDFKNYDKAINCFKINSKLYNRPPPQII
jgi:hypothetical protein